MEEWRLIPGLPDKYQVSSFGRVRRRATTYESFNWGKPVTRRMRAKVYALAALSRKGYQRINLDGRIYQVHRLIASVFVPNPLGMPQVNHRDGIKTNNRATNLEWVTNQQNRDHAVAHNLVARGPKPAARKYTASQVAEMIAFYSAGNSTHAVQRKFGVFHTSFRKMLKREGVPMRSRREAAFLRKTQGPAQAHSTG